LTCVPRNVSKYTDRIATKSPKRTMLDFPPHCPPKPRHSFIPKKDSKIETRDSQRSAIPDSALDATRRFLCAVLPTRAWLNRLPRSPRPNGHRETPADCRPRRYRVLQPPPPVPDVPPRVEFPVCLSHHR